MDLNLGLCADQMSCLHPGWTGSHVISAVPGKLFIVHADVFAPHINQWKTCRPKSAIASIIILFYLVVNEQHRQSWEEEGLP